jgi:hypothetical protein
MHCMHEVEKALYSSFMNEFLARIETYFEQITIIECLANLVPLSPEI